jgi:quaternary ammonium compound-resistance protein SugE
MVSLLTLTGGSVMAWVYLVLAGIMEIGWPVGLKYAQGEQGFRLLPAIAAGISMAVSGWFLFLAQKTIPMGTAYAVWTGIGSIGTFFIGILIFKEPNEVARYVCVGLIAFGIIGLKIFSSH